jgi:antitoxin ParD1/3/4
MAKNTSILLGEYFEKFISHQVKTGRYASASEVVRTALRLFEQEENQKKALVNELKAGEKSGFVSKVDKKAILKKLHSKI